MAKRESQGLQIALILVVMLAVLMAITTIVFWNQAKNRGVELASAKNDSQQAQTRLRDTVGENQSLKEMLGYPPDQAIDKITEGFEPDKQKFGANFPDENQNYRQLPEFMGATIDTLHFRLKASEDRVGELEQANANLLDEKNKAVEIEREASEKANQDLLKVRAAIRTRPAEDGRQAARMETLQNSNSSKNWPSRTRSCKANHRTCRRNRNPCRG